jgi:hypothetical protein
MSVTLLPVAWVSAYRFRRQLRQVKSGVSDVSTALAASSFVMMDGPVGAEAAASYNIHNHITNKFASDEQYTIRRFALCQSLDSLTAYQRSFLNTIVDKTVRTAVSTDLSIDPYAATCHTLLVNGHKDSAPVFCSTIFQQMEQLVRHECAPEKGSVFCSLCSIATTGWAVLLLAAMICLLIRYFRVNSLLYGTKFGGGLEFYLFIKSMDRYVKIHLGGIGETDLLYSQPTHLGKNQVSIFQRRFRRDILVINWQQSTVLYNGDPVGLPSRIMIPYIDTARVRTLSKRPDREVYIMAERGGALYNMQDNVLPVPQTEGGATRYRSGNRSDSSTDESGVQSAPGSVQREIRRNLQLDSIEDDGEYDFPVPRRP